MPTEGKGVTLWDQQQIEIAFAAADDNKGGTGHLKEGSSWPGGPGTTARPFVPFTAKRLRLVPELLCSACSWLLCQGRQAGSQG